VKLYAIEGESLVLLSADENASVLLFFDSYGRVEDSASLFEFALVALDLDLVDSPLALFQGNFEGISVLVGFPAKDENCSLALHFEDGGIEIKAGDDVLPDGDQRPLLCLN
jgi:hypothetical protein